MAILGGDIELLIQSAWSLSSVHAADPKKSRPSTPFWARLLGKMVEILQECSEVWTRE